jgi:hypothetical protein
VGPRLVCPVPHTSGSTPVVAKAATLGVEGTNTEQQIARMTSVSASVEGKTTSWFICGHMLLGFAGGVAVLRSNQPSSPSPHSFRSSWREWLGAWKNCSVEAEEFRELDDDRVLVLNRYRGRGKTSGVELGQMHAQAATLLHVRAGKVTKFVGYWDRERALADLGLEG